MTSMFGRPRVRPRPTPRKQFGAAKKGMWVGYRFWDPDRIEVELWHNQRLSVYARFYGPSKASVLRMVAAAIASLPDKPR